MKSFLKYFLNLLVFSTILLLSHCSPSREITKNENISPRKYFENIDNFSFNVKDQRNFDAQAIQSYDGHNSFYFKTPIAKYIQRYFNQSLLPDTLNPNPKIVNLFIDQLKFEQDNSLKYSFRFSNPINDDSSVPFRVASKYIAEKNSPREPLKILDNALTECLDAFFNRSKIVDSRSVVVQTNSNIKQNVSTSTSEDSIILIDTIKQNSDFNSKTISEVIIDKVFEKKINTQAISFMYNFGENIESGFQVAYNRRISSNNLFFYGYGVGLLYYEINNLSDGFKGFLISAAFPLSIEYYLSDGESRPYIGASLKLASGNEKIDYGGFEKNYFFFGPTIESYIGFKYSNSVSIDAGPYVLALLGSKMLPNDFGARINIYIWFN
jgi:hypothetical protein